MEDNITIGTYSISSDGLSFNYSAPSVLTEDMAKKISFDDDLNDSDNQEGDKNFVYIDYNKFENIKKQIDDLVLLKDNWDGYGGIPVVAIIAEKAKSFLALLNDSIIDKISDVFPNPHGTITIEWENYQGEKVSLELGINNFSYFVYYKNTEPKLVDGDNIPDIGQITSEIQQLVGEDVPFKISQD